MYIFKYGVYTHINIYTNKIQLKNKHVITICVDGSQPAPHNLILHVLSDCPKQAASAQNPRDIAREWCTAVYCS